MSTWEKVEGSLPEVQLDSEAQLVIDLVPLNNNDHDCAIQNARQAMRLLRDTLLTAR